MKAIIIEDEVNVREGFIKLIRTFCPEVDILATADGVESGLEILAKYRPDMLFLDINLPDGSGFDLIYRIQDRSFHTIFVTAYDHYALDAFKVSAVDYLLKPVSPDLLIKAVQKAGKKENEIENHMRFDVLKDRIKNTYEQSEKLILSDTERMELVHIHDIIYCEAKSSYTIFHLGGSRKFMASTNLKEYERILKPYGFIRSHHSILVNVQHIKSIQKTEGGSIILSNGNQVALSKRKKTQVFEAMKSYFIS